MPQADNAAFAAAGIGGFEPFFFERRGRARRMAAAVRVAFTLAFAAEPTAMPDAGFFACEQHEPQNFWSAGLTGASERRARTLKGVVMLAEDAGGAAALPRRP